MKTYKALSDGSILCRLPKSPVFEIQDDKLRFLVDDAIAFSGG
jgi:hypothetical protein